MQMARLKQRLGTILDDRGLTWDDLITPLQSYDVKQMQRALSDPRAVVDGLLADKANL